MKDESDSLDRMVEACSEVILAVQKVRRLGMRYRKPTGISNKEVLEMRMSLLQVEIDSVMDEWSL